MSLPRTALIALLIVGGAALWQLEPATREQTLATSDIDAAYRDGTSGIMVSAEGKVQRILPDDVDGSAHQRFIVEIPSGLTVLIAHNIDLAPRVPDLRVGASIVVRGQYEWNERGGLVHWTHHDPAGRREGGWIDYRGERYQ